MMSAADLRNRRTGWARSLARTSSRIGRSSAFRISRKTKSDIVKPSRAARAFNRRCRSGEMLRTCNIVPTMKKCSFQRFFMSSLAGSFLSSAGSLPLCDPSDRRLFPWCDPAPVLHAGARGRRRRAPVGAAPAGQGRAQPDARQPHRRGLRRQVRTPAQPGLHDRLRRRGRVLTIWFWDEAGALLASRPFDLARRQLLVLNTATVPGLAGARGSVALEPATGFTFDTLLVHRPR
jgi:hypothetical protein